MKSFLAKYIKSKTFYGSLIGLAALLIASGAVWPDAPANVVKILATVSTFLTIFGLVDAGNQEYGSWIEKIKAYKSSSPLIGAAFVVVVTIIDQAAGGSLPVSHNAVVFAQGLGAVITILGLRDEAAKARANTGKRHPDAVEKYESVTS
jgi:hypothetical protein